MGANSTQAFAVLLFLAGFVILAAGMSMGGSTPLMFFALFFLAGSAWLFLRARPWEHQE